MWSLTRAFFWLKTEPLFVGAENYWEKALT